MEKLSHYLSVDKCSYKHNYIQVNISIATYIELFPFICALVFKNVQIELNLFVFKSIQMECKMSLSLSNDNDNDNNSDSDNDSVGFEYNLAEI